MRAGTRVLFHRRRVFDRCEFCLRIADATVSIRLTSGHFIRVRIAKAHFHATISIR
jgi:hypothetical protein